MELPVRPPVAPMLARSAARIPPGMQYEGKWDGFRAIVFKDGDEIVIGSRNERPLTRYFPEVVANLQAGLPDRCVVDGEIVIVTGGRLDFGALQQRIHPAASRVRLLARQTPAEFIAFDLLAVGDRNLLGEPLLLRRRELEKIITADCPGMRLAPATYDIEIAREWFDRFEAAGLDGIVAKPLDGIYRPGERAMVKIKHERTADCVVAGFRWHKSGAVIGSLLLGLYDEHQTLQHVGVVGAFPMVRRRELVAELEPYRNQVEDHPWREWAEAEASSGDRRPGAVSRWNAGKDLSWVPLRPELVCEVAYDHLQGSRFRHLAQWRRWRPDRDPSSCTYAQLDRPTGAGVFDFA